MKKSFKYFVDTTFRANSKLGTRLRVLLPTGLFAIGFALLFAQEFRKNGEVTPRPTHAQLSKKRKDVQTDGKIEMADKPIKMAKIRSGKSESLIKRSAILSYGPYWTIVPKGSILHIPPHLGSRVNAEKKGKLLVWKEFQARNRGWLQLQNVSLLQARGEAQISEIAIESYRKSGRVVVAICHDGPISVKPPKETEPSGLARAGDATAKQGPRVPDLK